MPTVPCPACDRPVPAGWPACPNCGRSVRPRVRRRRPGWVYLVTALYLLLVAAVLDLPVLVVALDGTEEQLQATAIFSGIIFLLGASLLVIPIRTQFERPVRRRSVIFPLLVAAVCAAGLVGAGGLAVHEFLFDSGRGPTGEGGMAVVGAATVLTWLGWLLTFGYLARSVAPQTINDRMYQLLLAGSVVELLVALPLHLVVRRRTDCCAGMLTGFGIGVGLVVMLVALGPAVFFLFYRRYRQAYAGRRPGGPGA